MDLKERFLKYVSYDTQSSEESTTFPSTEKQKVLLAALRDEMEALGMTEVTMDQYGYVMGTVPASKGCENAPVIGFIAHVDTSPDMSGKDVKPRIVEEYDGGDLVLNGHLTMRVADFPELAFFKGHTLIHTDGTTLLGADDKAGIAEIMELCEILLCDKSIEHGEIGVAFTPDEEIGHGAALLDIEGFGCKYAYTVDGGALGELEYENFNAAQAEIRIKGVSIHPGDAKGKMKNALLIANELVSKFPVEQTPAKTEGYEGFFHLTEMSGSVTEATLRYIIRDHDMEKFEEKKAVMTAAADFINRKYGAGTLELTLKDSYYNMKKCIEPCMYVVERAKKAMAAAGMNPVEVPIRGGTDGARLSVRGLPCPNVFTGGMNFHGVYECIPVKSLDKGAEVAVMLAKKSAEVTSLQ